MLPETAGSVVIALALTPPLARAEADGPDFYRIEGLAPGGVLSVRASGSAEAARTGELPADADGIRNLGCEGGLAFAAWQQAMPAEREAAAARRWCKVEYRGVTGWVAARHLAEGSAPR